MYNYPYQFEYICSYSAQLAAPEVIGPVPEGLRANFYIGGGEASGPRLRGVLRAAGGDWLTVRRDGIGVLDVRGTMETHDGALIDLAYNGVGDLGEDGYEKFLRGELPPKIALRAAPRLRSAHPAYAWVNRLHFLNVGEVNL